MNKQDVAIIKEEVAQLSTRLDNIEGYFQNFDTTLNNHMTDYKREQEAQGNRITAVEKGLGHLNTLFWIIFTLLTVILGAGGALLVALAMEYFKTGRL